ncbi:hypothetical protein Q1695_008214 [Nippostrongylus brasiliensis]|nr:hypothetical protein Q1695_008214 [Nippostrongylus brasiliensis]
MYPFEGPLRSDSTYNIGNDYTYSNNNDCTYNITYNTDNYYAYNYHNSDNNDHTYNNNRYCYTGSNDNYDHNNNNYYYTEDNDNNDYAYNNDNNYYNDKTYNNYNNDNYDNYDRRKSSLPNSTFPALNTMCPGNVGISDPIRNKALDMINYRRMNLAAGKIQKDNGNLLPQAADMLKLRYGCGLEKQAKQQAETCSGVGSNLLGTKENFHRVSTSEASTEMQALQIATRYWWKSVRLVPGIGMKVTFRAHHQNSRIRFFTLMGWHTLRRIGCYVARCNAFFDVVCRYRPGGNIINEVVYVKGSPCSRCPTGTTCSDGSLCAFL